jgi:uncharacterized membrane protein
LKVVKLVLKLNKADFITCSKTEDTESMFVALANLYFNAIKYILAYVAFHWQTVSQFSIRRKGNVSEHKPLESTSKREESAWTQKHARIADWNLAREHRAN